MVAVFQQFGATEILIILVILLVLFGAKKLPELGKGLGKGIKEFRAGVKSVNEEVAEGLKDEESTADAKDEGSKAASSPDRSDQDSSG